MLPSNGSRQMFYLDYASNTSGPQFYYSIRRIILNTIERKQDFTLGVTELKDEL